MGARCGRGGLLSGVVKKGIPARMNMKRGWEKNGAKRAQIRGRDSRTREIYYNFFGLS